LPAPPSSVSPCEVPVIASSKAEPIAFSMEESVSPWASPPAES
jgi:hypothetical protein